jgi:hypothetical protein
VGLRYCKPLNLDHSLHRPYLLRWLVLACLAGLIVHHVLLRTALTLPWADDWIFIGRASSVAQGWQVALQRLQTWSPRPLSEFTIFTVLPLAQTLEVLPERLVQPLLLVSHLQALLILYWPLLLAPVRRSGYARLVTTVTLGGLVWLLCLQVDLHNLLFWGAASAAYVPAMAGWLSACCLIVLQFQLRRAGLVELILVQLLLATLACEVALLPLLLLPLAVYRGRHSRHFVLAHMLSFSLMCAVIVPVFLQRASVAGSMGSTPIRQGLPDLFGAWLQLLSWHDWRSWSVLALAGLLVLRSRHSNQWLLACVLLAVAAAEMLFFVLPSGISFDQTRYGLLVLLFLVSGGLLLIVSALAVVLPPSVRQQMRFLPDAVFSLGWLVLLLGSSQLAQWRGYAAQSPDLSPPRLVHRLNGGQASLRLGADPDPVPGRSISATLPAGVWTREQLRQLIAASPPGQRYPYKVLNGVLTAYRLDRIRFAPPLR